METRTSHSSPCFLRVAEASAASSASKMISLSTLFSFETASTTSRISLFITRTPSTFNRRSLRERRTLNFMPSYQSSQRGESCPADLCELYAHGEIVHIHLDALAVRTAKHARVSLAAIARHLELDLHAVVHELREMLRRAQYAVQSRRRNLERIRTRERIVGIEQIRQDVARIGAVVDVYPFGMVDINAQRSTARPGHELHFDEFVSDFFQSRLKQGDETVMQCRFHTTLQQNQQKRAPKALETPSARKLR